MPQSHQLSDNVKEMVRACQQGEQGARKQLINYYHSIVESHVTNLLHRYKCSHLIAEHRDEIIQLIWIELFTKINKFPIDEFSSWFAFLRRWRTLDYLRKEIQYQQHHSNLNQDSYVHAKAGSTEKRQSPEEILQKKQLHLEIKLCQKKLPARQREFINLFYFKGQTYKQIAAQFGIQESSVGTIHTRTIRNLKKILQKK